MAEFVMWSADQADIRWIGVRVPVSAAMPRWERQEHLARISRWLNDPTLAGLWYWYSVYGDFEGKHIALSSPNTAFACKMRWG